MIVVDYFEEGYRSSMRILEIILIGIGLAMDAFAVSVCKGLSMKKLKWENVFLIATYFGSFQAFMPLIGYFLGTTFQNLVTAISHWIAFAVLAFIGGNMIKESFQGQKNLENDSIHMRNMILLAVATSLDALAVGITFAFFKINVFLAIVIIGIITFLLSVVGVLIGRLFGDKLQNKAEMLGGIILIMIGIKILLEHFNFFH